MQPDITKQCRKCNQVKPSDTFGKDTRRPDGLFPYCKRCRVIDPASYDEISRQKDNGLLKCSTCKEWKSHDSFYSNAANVNRSYRHGDCISCSKVRTAEAYHADIKKARLRGRELSANRKPSIQRKNREQYRKKHQENLDRSRKWHHANYHAVREQRIAYLRRWAKTPRAKQLALANTHKRRAIEGSYTPEEWEAVLNGCGRICVRCGVTESMSVYAYRILGPRIGKLTIDHIVPVVKNGTNNTSNLQPLCLPCQLWKHDKAIDYRPHGVRKAFGVTGIAQLALIG